MHLAYRLARRSTRLLYSSHTLNKHTCISAQKFIKLNANVRSMSLRLSQFFLWLLFQSVWRVADAFLLYFAYFWKTSLHLPKPLGCLLLNFAITLLLLLLRVVFRFKCVRIARFRFIHFVLHTHEWLNDGIIKNAAFVIRERERER